MKPSVRWNFETCVYTVGGIKGGKTQVEQATRIFCIDFRHVETPNLASLLYQGFGAELNGIDLKLSFVTLALKISGINGVSSCPKFGCLWRWKGRNLCRLYLCVHHKPHDGSGLPRDGSGLPRSGSGLPHDGSGLPRSGSGLPRDGSGLPRDGSGLPRGGSGLPRDGSSLRRGGSGLPRGGQLNTEKVLVLPENFISNNCELR
jgi:hypothetical protein